MISKRRSFDRFKRGLDFVGAGIALVVLSPVIGVAAVAVRKKLGSPVIFKQARPGLGEEIFTLYKFRSMLDMDEANGVLTNEQRLTSFGQKLRALSLDELPSLINVLRGDMSLVGPRPLRVDYLKHYSPRQARRHEVRPGITGLAQVKGRNSLSWDDRFEMDVEYVDSRRLGLDFRIIVATVFQVFRRSDIEGDGMGAMSAFVGRRPEDGLTEEPLAEEWLKKRVELLNNPEIRKGITINFEPTIEGTCKWFASIKEKTERRDWVYLNEFREPVAMAGLSGVGEPDLNLYIFVDPAQQGGGYGRMVVNRLIYRARTYGAYRLFLEVKQENDPAIRLYESLGFKRMSEVRDIKPGKHLYGIHLKDEK